MSVRSYPGHKVQQYTYDEKGDQYAEKIAKLVGNANPMRVRFGHDD